MFLGDFYKLNKTPSDGTCLGEPPGGFCDVGCSCCFTSLEVFLLSLLFNVIPHSSVSYRWIFTPILYFQPSSLQSDSRHFHLIFLGFSVTALPRMLRFWAGVFTHRRFLPCTPSPHFGTFNDSDAGMNTPSRIFLCAYPHKVVPSGWCMVLNYSYCRYKTIDLPIAPVSHEV